LKYASIDLEGTGLDTMQSNIVEIGIVLDDLKNLRPISELPTFHAYISRERYDGEPYALSMHPTIFRRIGLYKKYGRDHEEIAQYKFLTPSKLAIAVKKFLTDNGYEAKRDKVTFNVAGKNFNGYDKQMLVNDIPDFAKHLTIRARALDPAILYYENTDDVLPSLSECLERAGLNATVAHTALEDAYQVVELIRERL